MGRNGGVVRRAWETLLSMEKYSYNVEEMNRGTVALIGDLAKAFDTVEKSCGHEQCISASRNDSFWYSADISSIRECCFSMDVWIRC